MKLDNLLDKKAAVDASTISNAANPWKERIIKHMTSLPAGDCAQTYRQILEATDDKYDGSNYTKRKHCLQSQLTYLRQDFNIRTLTVSEEQIVLLGIEKDKKLIPFTNAVPYLK